MSDDWKLKKAAELDEAALGLMSDIRNEYHARLYGFKITLLFRPKPRVSKGMLVLGDAKVLGTQAQLLSGYHGVVTVAWEWWQEATDEQKTALLDHELQHFDVDESGEKLSVRGHDVEEFFDVMVRRGAWTKCLHHAAQLLLPGMDADECPDQDDVDSGEPGGEDINLTITAGDREVHTTLQGLQELPERIAAGAAR